MGDFFWTVLTAGPGFWRIGFLVGKWSCLLMCPDLTDSGRIFRVCGPVAGLLEDERVVYEFGPLRTVSFSGVLGFVGAIDFVIDK